MPLTIGSRLGPYEILSPLGAGGMGEVYRARDTKLNRDVAIKILPEAFASDPERLARFTREAQTLAALNHPNIAHIHGLEETSGVRALVMELVEGETLAEKLAQVSTLKSQGSGLPLEEALAIARQIADALEAAHEKGIIHRDLKPANIMLTADGQVKVLDFGLAKALGPAAFDGAQAREAGHYDGPAAMALSPTMTNPAAMTAAGMILGTAAYMSPEQAKGRVADKRSDVWAFGCVFFEMLTGKRAFEGEDLTDTIAAVMRGEPDWTVIPPDVPRHIVTLVKRCLEKDRKARIGDVAVARFVLTEPAAPSAGLSTGPVLQVVAPPRAWRRALPWASTGALAAGLAAVLVLWVPWRKAAPPAPVRVSVELGADASLVTSGSGDAVILSPDGAVVAFVAQKGGGGSPQLYVRRLTQLQATALSGTDDADSPFFSPDGQWIAFFASGKLKKISVTGGAAVTLCDAPNGRGGAWGEDGTIVFTPDSGSGVRLLRVSSAGGKPEPLTSLAEGENYQRWPQVLPGGKAVLFTSSRGPGTWDDANLVAQPLPTGARTIVQRGGYHGRYLPSGHLVYIHDGTLFAAPFDLERLEMTGQPVPALEGVTSNSNIGSAQFAVSATGTLVYVPGQNASGGVPIHWMTHEGKTTPLRGTPANWFSPQFAPDGRRLAMNIIVGQSDIWVYEWARDTLTRLTSDPADDRKPVWTPDSRRIVFASSRGDKSTLNLYWQRADGTGDVQRLTESKNLQGPASWHPSGKFLAFEEQTVQTAYDLMILPMEGDEASGWKPGKPTVFLNSPFGEREPMFSPDGRWLAYQSNETGRQEVYVRPFQGPGGKWQISTGGGNFPTWSRTKRELFYGTPNGQIMVAAFTVEGDSFRAEKPRLWSDGRFGLRLGFRSFDLHPDGERFALVPVTQTQGGVKQDKVVFIFNFFDELRRIAPAAKR